MLAGDAYNASDPELVAERKRASALCQRLNRLPPGASAARRHALLSALFGGSTDVYVTPPFHCDYGYNVKLGANVYFNFNCVVLDVAPVVIGNNTLFGPAVQVYTALHPLSVEGRRTGTEHGRPVTIGDDVWVGGGAIVCAGVNIGSGSVIGAGSVVTRDIPAGVLAVGNPCRVVRSIQESAGDRASP